MNRREVPHRQKRVLQNTNEMTMHEKPESGFKNLILLSRCEKRPLLRMCICNATLLMALTTTNLKFCISQKSKGDLFRRAQNGGNATPTRTELSAAVEPRARLSLSTFNVYGTTLVGH